MSNNLKPTLQDKITQKEAIVKNGILKNLANDTIVNSHGDENSVDDRHIIVVNKFENSESGLMVQNQQQLQQANSTIPIQQDLLLQQRQYHQQLQQQLLQRDIEFHLQQHQRRQMLQKQQQALQLQQQQNVANLVNSESDNSANDQSVADESTVQTINKQRHINDDDVTSECTVNTSNWDADESTAMRKQLNGLETMYSQILTLLNTRMRGAKNVFHTSNKVIRSNRKRCGSVSSYGSKNVQRYETHKRSEDRVKTELKTREENTRIKKLETNVVTLAKSISQLSAEIRSNQALIDEINRLRADIDKINEQLTALRTLTTLETIGTIKRNANIREEIQNFSKSSKDGEQLRLDFVSSQLSTSSPSLHHLQAKQTQKKQKSEIIGRFDKLKRFFGDDPPLIRQFLKNIGYEKYASKFESEKIGMNELLYLTEERLQILGIPMGPRIRILQETNKLRLTNGNNTVYLV